MELGEIRSSRKLLQLIVVVKAGVGDVLFVEMLDGDVFELV